MPRSGGPVAHDDHRAQGDAGVHVAGEVNVPDGAGVGASTRRLEFVDDLHGPHLRRARHGPDRQRGPQCIESRPPRCEPTGNVRGDVHDVAVPLDRHHVGQFDTAEFSDSADIVATQIHEHDVLGPLLRIGQQLAFQRLIVFNRLTATARAGKRPIGDHAVLDPAHDLRRRPHENHLRALAIEHERRRVHHPQRPIDVERLGLRGQREPLGKHHLEDIAGPDVFLARVDRRLELRPLEVALERGRRVAAQIDRRQRTFY